MIRLDLEYSKRKSLLFDLLIIIKTPAVVIDHIRYFKINFPKKIINIGYKQLSKASGLNRKV